MTVLLVDDEKGIRGLLKSVLTSKGANVFDAASVEDALKLFQTNTNIDIVVTDVVMPGASGFDLAHAIRSTKPDVPCVFMSGHPLPDVDDEFTNCGFLAKPFGPDELMDMLSNLCPNC